jgi:hypothetical protein
LIEPDRIAFVLSFMVRKFFFSLRGSKFHTAQSADRIVIAIRIQSVGKVRPELLNHYVPLPELEPVINFIPLFAFG